SMSCMLVCMALHSSVFLYSTFFFFFGKAASTEIYTLSLHDALPISATIMKLRAQATLSTRPDKEVRSLADLTERWRTREVRQRRSEEHTSELQSRFDLVCRLLLEKKKKHKICTL